MVHPLFGQNPAESDLGLPTSQDSWDYYGLMYIILQVGVPADSLIMWELSRDFPYQKLPKLKADTLR